jgi:mono/diheme cytochrome c family protein
MRVSLNIVLFIALIIVVVSTWYLRRDFTSRNVEFLPGMVISVPYDAQAENLNFPDHTTLQMPVVGTEAQKFFPLHYQANADDAKRAGEELVSPVPDSNATDLDRGTVVFATFCQPCHGAGALGDGNVVKRGFPPPPSLLAEKAKHLKDGQIFHIITYGQNNMPSLASQVSRLDRWRVINYVRTLQQKSILTAGK